MTAVNFWLMFLIVMMTNTLIFLTFNLILWVVECKKTKRENRLLVRQMKCSFQKIKEDLRKNGDNNNLDDVEEYILEAEKECKKSMFSQRKTMVLIYILKCEIKYYQSVLDEISGLASKAEADK